MSDEQHSVYADKTCRQCGRVIGLKRGGLFWTAGEDRRPVCGGCFDGARERQTTAAHTMPDRANIRAPTDFAAYRARKLAMRGR